MKIQNITEQQLIEAIKARNFTPGLEKRSIIAAVELLDLIAQGEIVREAVKTFTPAQHKQWQEHLSTQAA